MANENYEGFDLTIYNLFTLLREMYYTRGETETNFLSKSGGTLGGSLTIQGNLTVQGNSYKIDTENLVVKDYTITLAKDNDSALLSMVGMVVPKYDGTNYGFFGWDADGYAYVGDLTDYDGSSAITLAENTSLQKIATIKDTATGTTSDDVMVYDQTNKVFKKAPSGRYIIENNKLVAFDNDYKSLYNLGSFDTISGNVVSRGHWRLTKKDFKKQDGGWFASAMAPSSSADRGVSANMTFPYQYSYSFSSSHWYFESGAYAFCVSNDDIDNIVIDYKTIDTYQEDIIPNTPLLDLDQNGCNFLRNEWEKGLNLLPNYTWLNHYKIDETTGQMSAGAWYQEYNALDDYVELKPNTTYTLSASGGYGSRLYIYYYDSSKGYLSYSYIDRGSNEFFTFTTISTFAYVRFMTYGSGYQSALSQVMLVESSHAYPYQEYNGDIVHKVDIEPVLLWENPSPNSDFADQSVSLPSHNFKYYVCEFIQFKNEIKSRIFVKINSNASNVTVSCVVARSTTFLVREFGTYTGGMGFGDCYNSNSAVSNDSLIPYRIYGTNVL